MTKYIIVPQAGCVYRNVNGVLEYAPLYDGDSFYEEEFAEVDEELVGDELLPEPRGNAITFKELYNQIKIYARAVKK